ncbi:putative membrane protein [Wickerhamomyces ciferrii]|uniref:Membrane protein n=1 Tax=Wickerhamomyces ciferrii (strain ATCC 14091 / BCRC 22168 / CBS 111 / JCM 3599 / NBRC 0793 / NRRL Y-1031 F-60-10) TaxID=1206466 RepID=K0KN16_WICCF|nr:uncharacterized protein BN7_3924 [Wickerhamomyces ciferrii]CCH44361.1 putative membrane protein [Wickerhamomyces ciferrii]
MSSYLTRKPTINLYPDSPKIGAFEKQLSLIKTPELLLNDTLSPITYDLSDEPISLDELSPLDHSSVDSGAAQLEKKLNSLRKSNRLITSRSRQQQAEAQAAKIKKQAIESIKTPKLASPNLSSINRVGSLKFKVPTEEIKQLRSELELFITNIVHFIGGVTRNDVEVFFDGLSEIIIGVFVIFGCEIMSLSKDSFLVLVQLVTVSVIRIGFRNVDYDSLLFQSPIVSIFEKSNLPNTVKRSITHLITMFQVHLLLSTFRVTASFKSRYYIEESKIDSLTIMGLGLIMVLLCLNLLLNALPASRRYSS